MARVLRQMLLGVFAMAQTTGADEADAGIDDRGGFVHDFFGSKCEAIASFDTPNSLRREEPADVQKVALRIRTVYSSRRSFAYTTTVRITSQK